MINDETKYLMKAKRKIGVLLIEVTSKCNFNCKHCYNESESKFSQINLEKLISIREELKTFSYVDVIELSGGEFFLHKDWINILDIFSDYSIQITTNGTLLTREVLLQLKKYKCKLSVSLDGLRLEDNFLRNPSKVSKVIDGIDNVVRYYDKSLLTVHCTLNNVNYKHLDELVDFCIKRGVRLNYGCLCKLGKGKELPKEQIPSGVEIFNSYNNIMEVRVEKNVDISLPPIGVSSKCTLLTYASLSSRIDAKGNVFPCSSLVDEPYSIGNIYADSLRNIILDKNEKLRSIIDLLLCRHKFMRNGLCRNCAMSDECGGGCLPYALTESNNNFFDIPHRFCKAAKLLKSKLVLTNK